MASVWMLCIYVIGVTNRASSAGQMRPRRIKKNLPPLFQNPCTPPLSPSRLSWESTARQSGSGLLSSEPWGGGGDPPWRAYSGDEWFLGARVHSSTWNHRAGGGTHVFINTVRVQIMSHSKNPILAGVRDLFGRHSGRKVTHLRQAERNVRFGGKL